MLLFLFLISFSFLSFFFLCFSSWGLDFSNFSVILACVLDVVVCWYVWHIDNVLKWLKNGFNRILFASVDVI